MKPLERVLFYVSLVMYGIPCAVLWYLMLYDWIL